VPERLRVAVIGAGYFSRFHYQAWAAIEDVELVAACDRDRAKAEALAGPLGLEACFADAAEMLAEAAPDLVDIATPEASHAELLALSAGRGIATICQKPLAADLAAAQALVESAEAGGGLLVVHENFRFMPWFREAKRLLDSGSLGEPHAMAFRLRPGDGRGPQAYLARQPYFQTMERFLIHEK
jgi:predicted dehydrogenase